MITSNVIHRVFFIRCGNATGTAFTIDHEGRQYLVTAKHVLAGSVPLNVDIYSNGDWVHLPVTLVGEGPPDVDISVLAPGQRLTSAPLPLEATADGMTYGQDVFFLGFPYGIAQGLLGAGGFPLPLVKRATLSHIHAGVFLLDGHNNPGFSGGPVVYCPPTGGGFKVAGVISGFHAVEEPVLAGGLPTPFVYSANTGIILCHCIVSAVQLIQNNPIGFPLQ